MTENRPKVPLAIRKLLSSGDSAGGRFSPSSSCLGKPARTEPVSSLLHPPKFLSRTKPHSDFCLPVTQQPTQNHQYCPLHQWPWNLSVLFYELQIWMTLVQALSRLDPSTLAIPLTTTSFQVCCEWYCPIVWRFQHHRLFHFPPFHFLIQPVLSDHWPSLIADFVLRDLHFVHFHSTCASEFHSMNWTNKECQWVNFSILII